MKENARRRKKRELGKGDWWEESNRRRGEGGGTGNLSEVRRLRATRDLFAWAKSLRAVLLCVYIYIYIPRWEYTNRWVVYSEFVSSYSHPSIPRIGERRARKGEGRGLVG